MWIRRIIQEGKSDKVQIEMINLDLVTRLMLQAGSGYATISGKTSLDSGKEDLTVCHFGMSESKEREAAIALVFDSIHKGLQEGARVIEISDCRDVW